MSDGVLTGEIIAVANDLAVVKTTGKDGTVLGLCRVATGQQYPSGMWYHEVSGKQSLTLIGTWVNQSLVSEPIVDGVPLLIHLQGTTTGILQADGYPWSTWVAVQEHPPWHQQLAHFSHLLVGTVVILALMVAIALRRHHVLAETSPVQQSFLRRMADAIFGGTMGIGRDSFKGMQNRDQNRSKD